MRNTAISLTGLVITSLIAGHFNASDTQDNQDRKTIRRVERPVFDEKSGSDLYFENLFEEALAGTRPEKKTSSTPDSGGAVASTDSSKFAWSRYIDRETIEDEIKSINRDLQSQVTTAARFNSGFVDIRQQFNMLSMLFAIVHEFDQEIRWKQSARAAQMAFADAASRATSASRTAFENSVRRKDDLAELIRGGTVASDESPDAALEWSAVVDRQSIMVRLENALRKTLKPATSNMDEFIKQQEALQHQTRMVSALAQVLIRDSMEDADDDGYAGYSGKMGASAADALSAILDQDFELASRSVNAVEQVCNDCHGQWR